MLSDLAKDLRDTLTIDHQSREELCEILSCSDRSLRRAVSELRELGINVASSSHDKGYWLGTNKEMEIIAREYDSRAIKDFKIADAIRKGPDKGQQEVSI